jgi:hypothetical protein
VEQKETGLKTEKIMVEYYLHRDRLATVGLDPSWAIKSLRLLLATLVSPLFSTIFIELERSCVYIKLMQ